MIVKGASRSGPQQLAVYLMRVGRYDTGEPTQLLDFQSIRAIGVDANDRERTAAELVEAFRDWQTSVEATQRGRDGLYHCEISPEARYARDMTKKDWLRLADIAGQELGLDGQRRAVVLHAGKDGRPHLHVVWERTDLQKMKVISDGYNYVAHERASHRMEREFGHEFIPGKHAKRDRKRQEEFPRQKLTQDEDQYQKRTGLSKADREKQIAALYAAADNGPALKAALEDAGYILAKGDRGYVVVDQKGGHSVLSRNTGLKKKELEAFMAGVALDKLPTIDDAKATQSERRRTVSKSNAPTEAEKQGVEASEFLGPQEPKKAPEQPAPLPDAEIKGKERETDRGAPESSEPPPIDPERRARITALRAWSDGAFAFKKALEETGYTLARGKTGYLLFSDEGTFSLVRHAGLSKAKLDAFMSPVPLDSLPNIQDLIEASKQARVESKFIEREWPQPEPPATKDRDNDLDTRVAITALDRAVEAIAEAQKHASPDPELEALEKAIAKRYMEESVKMRDRHAYELRSKEVEMDRETVRQLDGFKRLEDEQVEKFLKDRQEHRTGIWGIIDAINSRWNPTLAAEKAKDREQERQNFYRRLAKERADYEVLLQQNKQLEIENLIERQSLQRGDFETRSAEDKERHVREHHEAKRIAAEMEQERLKQEELERDENLREGPPPPKLGK